MLMKKTRKFTIIISFILIISLLSQIYPVFHNLENHAKAQPEIIDNGDFTITVKDNFSHPMLETWANINDIQRMPNEKDNDLRKHIMGKISKRG